MSIAMTQENTSTASAHDRPFFDARGPIFESLDSERMAAEVAHMIAFEFRSGMLIESDARRTAVESSTDGPTTGDR